MSVYRKWYCTCSGDALELDYTDAPLDEDEEVEPVCDLCGATPSSDPKRTITYRDVESWDD